MIGLYIIIGGRRKFLPGHGAPPCREAGTREQSNVIATIFLHFLANSCRKVSKNDKFAAKSNIFLDFMLDIVEKVLTLQRI